MSRLNFRAQVTGEMLIDLKFDIWISYLWFMAISSQVSAIGRLSASGINDWLNFSSLYWLIAQS
jgi:hypothetical protein